MSKAKNGLEHISDKLIIEKASLTRVETNLLPKKLPVFKNSKVTKDILIAKWVENWIKQGLKTNKFKAGMLFPKKADIAAHLGSSLGTVQNAIRYIEDEGFVESKQRIGTLIKDSTEENSVLRKQTSKRDLAIKAIQKYIIDKNCEIGKPLPSSRDLAVAIGCATNTTRLALEYLSTKNIIKSMGNRGNKANWILVSIPNISSNENINIETDTLVDMTQRDLKAYIQENFSVGDKLPPHKILSNELKVSIKTVHDAMKVLINEGILSAKRGRYGTTIIRLPNQDKSSMRLEDMIFAPAQDAKFYNYEKIEEYLKNTIATKYNIGDKLPPMNVLAKELNVSGNTIRKAVQSLQKQCLIEISRGKYGGTVIVNKPKNISNNANRWFSLNEEHAKIYKK